MCLKVQEYRILELRAHCLKHQKRTNVYLQAQATLVAVLHSWMKILFYLVSLLKNPQPCHLKMRNVVNQLLISFRPDDCYHNMKSRQALNNWNNTLEFPLILTRIYINSFKAFWWHNRCMQDEFKVWAKISKSDKIAIFAQ